MINKNLFDNESAIFMGAKRNPDDCSIGIFGVNYDGTCSYKSGTRFCLLYTSPSPRDRTRPRMPSSA